MITLRFDELAALTGGKLYNQSPSASAFTGVSIDSRTLAEGELFVAIRGENRDGHEYIRQAIERGASGLLVEADRDDEAIGVRVPAVAVENSHEAMITLAKQYRHTVKARFVGITGSNGKTTTKELAWHLLRAVEPSAYRSPGNLNNLYGVPLALFRIPQECKVAVLEMGISTEVEMPRLVEIVEPDVALITNVSATHLEFLNTVEDVARAKLELVRGSRADIPAIINADDPVLSAEARKVRESFVTFALDSEADFRPESWETRQDGSTRVVLEGHEFNLPLAGRHQVYNLTAAYAIARTLGYGFSEIDTTAIPLATAPMRGELVKHRGIRLLVDCYNANPENVKAGLSGFFSITGGDRRVVILGDMLELGAETRRYHEETGRVLADYDFDLAVFVGPLAIHMRDAAIKAGVDQSRVMYFDRSPEAAEAAEDILRENDFVYIKGSRGIGLEAIVRKLENGENN